MTNSATTATAPSTPTDQRTRHCATNESSTAPPWFFTHSETGIRLTVTCMPECTIDHSSDIETPTHPDDIYCWADPEDTGVTLPIDTGDVEDYRILNSRVEMHPYSGTYSQRLPFAVIEVIDDHWISGLDPDALAAVIDVFAGRLESLRRTHADLVRIRAEYAADQIISALRKQETEATA